MVSFITLAGGHLGIDRLTRSVPQLAALATTPSGSTATTPAVTLIRDLHTACHNITILDHWVPHTACREK